MPSLDSMPPEILAEITQHLDPSTQATLRYLSPTMHALTSKAPIMSSAQYTKLHKDFEAQFRRNAFPSLKLHCTGCMTILPRANFQDSKAKNKCEGPRVCMDCSALRGNYDNAGFMCKDVKSFWCAGCHKQLPVEQEGEYTQAREAQRSRPRVRGERIRKVETAGRRWCKRCWETISLWEVCHGPRAPQFLVERYGLDRGLRYNIHGVLLP